MLALQAPKYFKSGLLIEASEFILKNWQARVKRRLSQTMDFCLWSIAKEPV
jgi:hypothetical protein